ncbi:MAG: calcium-translocating P-type ATPase, PMCA-type [Bacteroidaceae bacterium]|nr:calcium-translocating P-type ATPase, PMCA-type [Bacteroidaceae bacterium]
MEPNKLYSGLTDTQVKENRQKYGANILTPPKRESLWKIFIENFKDPVIRILLMAVVLSVGISVAVYFTEGTFEIAETIGIAIAIVLATSVSTWFINDANKKFDLLNQVNDDTLMRVVRNGSLTEVPKKDIVVGDIVLLEQGEEIPADGILLEAVSLEINESSLTGEPATRKTVVEEDFDPAATYPSNLVLRGTTVIDGHGTMEVTTVGDATEFGKVAKEATEKSEEETPLNKQLNVLAKFISVVGFGIAGITFCILFVKGLFYNPNIPAPTLGQFGLVSSVIFSVFIALANIWIPVLQDLFYLLNKTIPQWLRPQGKRYYMLYAILSLAILLPIGYACGVKFWERDTWISLTAAKSVLNAFMAAVTLIVVAIPEGLPMSVTLSLALSMRKMLKANNLVRKMHACETMGAATVICTDKTGTLTQNRMSVHETDFFALPDQKLTDNIFSQIIIESIACNTTAFLENTDDGTVKTLGNPTEAALLLWLQKQNINYLPVREEATIIEQLTFSTERKYMATLIDSPSIGKKVLYVKGAPEIILANSRSVKISEGLTDIPDKRGEIEAKLLDYQNQAMRTLGFAYEIIEDDSPRFENGKLVNTNLTFIGIAAISDPIRPDVPAAIQRCFDAGIQVKIVTGDTPGTAKEIGRKIGLWKPEDTEMNHITGSEFAALNDEEAFNRVEHLKIMSRARPTDKQRLVQLLQKHGEVLAVTGDGTNDAPALNFAHVGLSMGTGTSVAKEASDITLLDDSFNSIASAVMWGRSVFLNIQRFILFQLTINMVALIIVMIGSILGSESPITVTQMLWVNLIMDTFAAGALASLPPDEKVMKQKPRNTNDFIIVPQMRRLILGTGLLFIIVLSGLLFYFADFGGGITNTAESVKNLTMFFTFFVMLQFWNMFNAKTFGSNDSAFKGLKKSEGFVLVSLAILLGQFIVVTFGGEVFRTVPLSAYEWLSIIVSSSLVLWIGEIIRFFKRFYAK